MSKTNKKEELKQDKVMTKYDRKMQERKEKAAKEKKDNLISLIAAIVFAVVLVGGVIIALVVTLNSEKKAISGTYLTVGEHEVSKVEYDYYYNIMYTDYMNTYSSFLPYMGFDSAVDPDLQAYDDSRTWGDVFDEIAVEQIRETKAMVDDAKAAGFVYETEDDDYRTFVEGFQVQADASGLTLADYYKFSFGEYATQSRIAPYIKETLYVGAYADKLAEDFAPTDEEITAQYEANKNNYDTITYNLYTFSADIADGATEDEIATAMADAEAKANEMKEACIAGEDFQALCNKYDSEGEANENTETLTEALGEDKNKITGATYSLISSLYADWLYDDTRTADEVEVFVDEDYNRYYVVQFVEKVYEETTNDTISAEISGERVSEYKAGLVEKYEVKDVAGELNYLENPLSSETTEEVTEEATEEVAE